MVQIMEPWEKAKLVVEKTENPITKKRLINDLKNLGLQAGDIVISHFSMSEIGWIVGEDVTVIDALLETLTPEGTLVMPSHTAIVGNPANWRYPAVPESWWQTIRDNAPTYDPQKTPTERLGRIPETFRSYPEVLRSDHPQVPFASWGMHAKEIVTGQQLMDPFGKGSPLEKIYNLQGKVLLIGVGHLNNTSLHFAEVSANIPNFPTVDHGVPVIEDGKRIWKTWKAIDIDSDDFPEVGAAFEKEIGYRPKLVGQAESRLLPMKDLIDFAIGWFERNRHYEN